MNLQVTISSLDLQHLTPPPHHMAAFLVQSMWRKEASRQIDAFIDTQMLPDIASFIDGEHRGYLWLCGSSAKFCIKPF